MSQPPQQLPSAPPRKMNPAFFFLIITGFTVTALFGFICCGVAFVALDNSRASWSEEQLAVASYIENYMNERDWRPVEWYLGFNDGRVVGLEWKSASSGRRYSLFFMTDGAVEGAMHRHDKSILFGYGKYKPPSTGP